MGLKGAEVAKLQKLAVCRAMSGDLVFGSIGSLPLK